MRVGLVVMCTLAGWISGKVFDMTGSYGAASRANQAVAFASLRNQGKQQQ